MLFIVETIVVFFPGLHFKPTFRFCNIRLRLFLKAEVMQVFHRQEQIYFVLFGGEGLITSIYWESIFTPP